MGRRGALSYHLILAFLLVESFELGRVQVRADQYDEGGLLVLVLTLTALPLRQPCGCGARIGGSYARQRT